jgi:hypothetical protein
MKVSWDDDIPNIWKNKKCSKPPTRYRIMMGKTGGFIGKRLTKSMEDVMGFRGCSWKMKHFLENIPLIGTHTHIYI